MYLAHSYLAYTCTYQIKIQPILIKPSNNKTFRTKVMNILSVSGWCQDGNTSSRVITEVQHLELNQPSDW